MVDFARQDGQGAVGCLTALEDGFEHSKALPIWGVSRH